MIPVNPQAVKFSGDVADYERVPAGCYVCKVVSATPNNDKQYLMLCLDIIEGEFAHFGEKTEERTQKDYGYIKVYKSWRDNGKEDGHNPLYFFRQMLARFEEENPGKYQQTDMDEKHLVGLKIGVRYGEEEYINKNGEVKITCKFRDFAVIENIHNGKAKIPTLKKLPPEKQPTAEQQATADSFGGTVVDEGKCPF